MYRRLDQFTHRLKPQQHYPFHVMIKPAGATCNLNCAYCYYLSKQNLYPQVSSRMSKELFGVTPFLWTVSDYTIMQHGHIQFHTSSGMHSRLMNVADAGCTNPR